MKKENLASWSDAVVHADDWEILDESTIVYRNEEPFFEVRLEIRPCDKWDGFMFGKGWYLVALGSCDTVVWQPDCYYDLACSSLRMAYHATQVPSDVGAFDAEHLPEFTVPDWFLEEVDYCSDEAAEADSLAYEFACEHAGERFATWDELKDALWSKHASENVNGGQYDYAACDALVAGSEAGYFNRVGGAYYCAAA